MVWLQDCFFTFVVYPSLILFIAARGAARIVSAASGRDPCGAGRTGHLAGPAAGLALGGRGGPRMRRRWLFLLFFVAGRTSSTQVFQLG